MDKKFILALFIVVALAQLYVPAKMIYDRENVIATGKEFRFRIAPVDPYDPFRGKYIILRFDENSIRVKNAESWEINDVVYVKLKVGSDGFARVDGATNQKPDSEINYVKARVGFVETYGRSPEMTIEYPFERFYMEESKAGKAEQIYNELLRDSLQLAYALVAIKNGNAVLKDVFINNTSVRKLAGEK